VNKKNNPGEKRKNKKNGKKYSELFAKGGLKEILGENHLYLLGGYAHKPFR